MKIARVVVGTSDLESTAEFHRSVLQLPVLAADEQSVTVGVGPAVVRYERRPAFEGVHHLAFGLAPEDFDRAHAFLAARVEILRSGDHDVIDGVAGWDSRSIYFRGPGGLVLEYIAHHEHGGRGRGGPVPTPLGIAEVGVGVLDVGRAVADLAAQGLPPFPPQEEDFAPVGTPDGMLILVRGDRAWFPERRHRAARDPVTVTLADTGARAGAVSVADATILLG